MRWPIRGGSVCKKHGAGAPQVAEAARRRLAAREVAATLADVEVVPIAGRELDALADLAAEVLAFKDHVASLLGQLDELTVATMFGPQVHVLIPLWERAVERSQKFLADWVRLGFEDRKIRVDEVRAGLHAVAMAGALRELGLDPGSPEVLTVLDRWLPVLDGAPPPLPDEPDP